MEIGIFETLRSTIGFFVKEEKYSLDIMHEKGFEVFPGRLNRYGLNDIFN